MRSSYAFAQRFVALVALFSAALVSAGASAQTLLFADAFDSEETTVVSEFANTPVAVGATDWMFIGNEQFQNDVRYGYDYSAINIPEAPNSEPGDTATTGVALRTNVSLGAADQAGIFIEDENFTGSYRVEVDMYLSWAADSAQIGTTEHGGLFIGSNTPTNEGNIANFPASQGAGMLLSTDGDTVNFDHVLLKNDVYPSIESGQYGVTDFGFGTQLGYDNTDVNTDPANGDLINLAELYPSIEVSPGVTQNAGAAGYRWVTLTADVDTEALGNGTGTETGLTTFTVTIADSGESYTLGTLDNSIIDDINDGPLNGFDEFTEQGPVNMSGRVTLTLIDFFTSVASDINLATVVFDNLVVTALEDTPGLAADFNGDGTVDLLDLDILGANFGGPGDAMTGDANDDGTVDLLDLDILGSQFGQSASSALSVPEPTSAVLVVLAAAAAARRRRS
ncbi:MAG: PEP-CTERM sorting domain-containing protein [Planctomycetota bacterium]